MTERFAHDDASVSQPLKAPRPSSRPCTACNPHPIADEDAENIVLATAFETARNGRNPPTETAELERWMFTTPLRQLLAVGLLRPDPDAGPLDFLPRLHATGDRRRFAAVSRYLEQLDQHVPAAFGPPLLLAVTSVRNAAYLRMIRSVSLTMSHLTTVRGTQPTDILPRLEALTTHIRRIA